MIGDATAESQAKRYSPVVMRMAAEHDLDLRRSRAPAAAGASQRRTCWRTSRAVAAEQPPMHIESPYRPDEPAIKRKPRAAPAARRGGTAKAGPRAAPASPRSRAAAVRMRQAIGSRMVQSLQTAATCTTIAEADMSRIEAARKAAKLSYLPYQARATIETLLEFPMLNATLKGDQHTVYNDAVHLGIAVTLGQRRPDRPDHPRRAGPERRRAGQAHQGHRRPGAQQPAHAGRGERRHVHDHQPRRLRLDHGHAGDQPAAGRRSSTPRPSSSGRS